MELVGSFFCRFLGVIKVRNGTSTTLKVVGRAKKTRKFPHGFTEVMIFCRFLGVIFKSQEMESVVSV